MPRLSETIADLTKEVDELREELTALREQLAAREEEVVKLRAALERAQRSGKRQAGPFSKGPPKDRPKKPGRKSGDDYGRKERRSIPKSVDEILDAALPSSCPSCGGGVVEDRVEQQYQTEVPKIEPFVRQFDVHVGHCADCGCRLQGRHPQQTSDALGAAASQLGPRAAALASQLQKELGLSYGKAQRLFREMLGIEVSRGGLAQAIYRVAARVEPTYQAMREALPRAPVITPDETGWRVGGHSAWLWVFNAVDFVVYGVLPGRGFDDAIHLLPEDYTGTLVRDGWSPYRRYERADHQTCLRHFLSRCSELLEVAVRGAARVPRAVQRILRAALELRDRRDRGEVGDRGLRVLRGKLEASLERLLRFKPTHHENRKLLQHLRNEHELGAVLRFLDVPNLPATNYRAEQDIRPAVVNRKTWGGNRTWNGAAAQERLASFFVSARRQALDAIDLLKDILCSPTPKVAPFRGIGPPPP